MRDLLFAFDQQSPLLRIDSLELTAGHSLGICGASGAGKTTLFHCLSGITSVSSGMVQWGGVNLSALSSRDLARWRHQNLGLIFQDFHLVDGLSALDNVLLPAYFDKWKPLPSTQARARELLASVGIATEHRVAALLSRGERQRVAFARALLMNPAIVMADEPTASLDPEHRAQVGRLLVELSRAQGASLIVISHEEALLARMDRSLRLHHGGLHEHGLPELASAA